MRLQVVFVLLLTVTATGASLAVSNLAPAREGGATAQAVAIAGAVVALAGGALLARIVIRLNTAGAHRED